MPQTERHPRPQPDAAERKRQKKARVREIPRASHSACGWALPTQLAFEPLAAQQPRLRRAYRRLSGSAKKLSRWVLFISDSPFCFSLLSDYSTQISASLPLLSSPGHFIFCIVVSRPSPCWPSALSPALPGTACEQLPALPPPGRFRYETPNCGLAGAKMD